ncbi:MAG: energy transducer TonB, partial [Porphyromonadaceae bacterium]|nr:energy transducer TonB [Porphyromonadaceae bacterium]
MAKIDLISKDWCELIFNGRNKAYGAYSMRMNTPKRFNIATAAVVIAVILVVTLPALIKFIT